MRASRVRFTVRRMMIAVAVVALGLAALHLGNDFAILMAV